MAECHRGCPGTWARVDDVLGTVPAARVVERGRRFPGWGGPLWGDLAGTETQSWAVLWELWAQGQQTAGQEKPGVESDGKHSLVSLERGTQVHGARPRPAMHSSFSTHLPEHVVCVGPRKQ